MEWHKSICNEMFGSLDFSRTCALLSMHGFTGIELAPFTLCDERGRIGNRRLLEIRSAMETNGITFAGLHWLFAFPKGLHVTSRDPKEQMRAKDHLRHLLDVAGALGGGNLILGSPKQRSVVDVSPQEGVKRLGALLTEVADDALAAHSVICLEALSKQDTNVLNTLEESRMMVETIGHPAIQGMFDFHNCGDEVLLWEVLVEQYRSIIKHVHLNRIDGGFPLGSDIGQYLPTFAALASSGFPGWISLEIFSVPEDPELVLEETGKFLRHMEQEHM